ncbi:DUF6194 family protein [Nocardiopsis tropica]|uniref:DUF6194 family protein n=1 Tax=Nocardiopsis tropica TaxID=109330 RepID=A0ABU7KVV5_9ACTN|nr:DUF6194 family protein [Nocardiopsis umidischolae]MEE2053411.1 DUF6194 family protein [Nocardiopsis umidischolae]
MTIEEIMGFVGGLDGVLTLRPGPGDGSPELSWGDTFFYYAPDGEVPRTTQPFATIVTKDYPEDTSSRLDRPGAFRLNISAGKDAFVELTGRRPRDASADGADPSETDVLVAHPVYGALGWLAVVEPGPRTEPAVRDLLVTAHSLARSRYERRAGEDPARPR